MPNNNNILDAKVVVPLKYLSNLQRSLDLPLINCETEIDLLYSNECTLSETSITPAVAGNPNVQTREAR